MAREGELGALWWKKGQSGDFLSGHILVGGVKTQIVCFPKREKKNDKQPDFDILVSRPRPAAAEEKQGHERHDVDAPAAAVEPEDIPF